MNLRATGAVCALLAAALHFGVAGPLHGRVTALLGEHRVLREDRREARERLREAAAREDLRRQAAALVRAAGPAGDEEAAREVRRAVVAALGTAEQVRLTVRPAAAGVNVQLTAEAPYAEAVALLGRLTRPDAGIVLEEVILARAGDRVSVQVGGVAFRGAP